MRPTLPLLLLALALALAGCGLGAGPAPRAIGLLVTGDFGTSALRASRAPQVVGEETVMSLLMRNYEVSTRFGGGFVQSINGLAGGHEGGQPVDWFYYVNGVQASKGAAETVVHPGDHIWWDHHDWSQTQDVPAVVGSFPEPFLNGLEGRRLPVRIECEQVSGPACRAIDRALHAFQIPAAIAALGAPSGAQTLSIVVGLWPNIEGQPAAHALPEGPHASGVYARPQAHGHTLTLLDRDGHVVGTLGAGAGLIAATRQGEDAPAWVLTGTDERGLQLAARAFDRSSLEGHFAIAVSPAGVTPLPASGG